MFKSKSLFTGTDYINIGHMTTTFKDWNCFMFTLRTKTIIKTQHTV
jgi:hypothetical protein